MQRKVWFDFQKRGSNRRALRIRQTEARGVPDLVGEVAIRLDLFLIPTGVGRSYLSKCQARGVDTKLVEDLEGIDAVPFRLRHSLPVLVQNCSCDKHIIERSLVDKFHSHHHHPRNPEEDDVASSYQHRRGIEGL